MKGKKWFYAIFFTALVFAFYFAAKALIPGFSEKRTMEPVSYIRPFVFQNQDGDRFTEKNVAGKVFVAAFFFTTCKGICPRMNTRLKQVHEALLPHDDFLILSHTCDPETDSVSRLKSYTDSLSVDTRKWIFLTGRKDSLYQMARISYTIDDPANNLKSIEDDFLHTQFWALVDRNGDVRKIYDGLKKKEVAELIRDAGNLLKEKPKDIK